MPESPSCCSCGRTHIATACRLPSPLGTAASRGPLRHVEPRPARGDDPAPVLGPTGRVPPPLRGRAPDDGLRAPGARRRGPRGRCRRAGAAARATRTTPSPRLDILVTATPGVSSPSWWPTAYRGPGRPRRPGPGPGPRRLARHGGRGRGPAATPWPAGRRPEGSGPTSVPRSSRCATRWTDAVRDALAGAVGPGDLDPEWSGPTGPGHWLVDLVAANASSSPAGASAAAQSSGAASTTGERGTSSATGRPGPAGGSPCSPACCRDRRPRPAGDVAGTGPDGHPPPRCHPPTGSATTATPSTRAGAGRECRYSTGVHTFTERSPSDPTATGTVPAAAAAARLLFLLAGVSYYKTTAAPVIDLGEMPTTAAERAFLRPLLPAAGWPSSPTATASTSRGLGWRARRRGPNAPLAYLPVPGRPLFPFGGGIDSIVTVDAPSRSTVPTPPSSWSIHRATLRGHRRRRRRDRSPGRGWGARSIRWSGAPAELGFLNGHVPVTASSRPPPSWPPCSAAATPW